LVQVSKGNKNPAQAKKLERGTPWFFLVTDRGKQKPRSSKRGLNGAPSGSFWSLIKGNKNPAQAKEA
jgi:hypothetical protein